MINLTKLYYYDKAVAKLSKVYGVSKQTVKDHFDDMNVELFYQIRKAFGMEYPYYLIKQSDIEECRKWLGTHKDELAKVDEPREVKKPCNSDGYILDNHKDEPLHFNTQREVADFLGYKATGFVIGRVYRGYELKRGRVPESNSIINTNPGESIANDSTSNTEVANKMANSETEMANRMANSDDEQQPLNTTVDSNDNSMYTQESFEEDLNLSTEVEPNETTANDTTSDTEVTELPMSDIEAGIKSDFESKVDAYFSKYYDLD